eukprot:4349689-Amphidinium_carterae.2
MQWEVGRQEPSSPSSSGRRTGSKPRMRPSGTTRLAFSMSWRHGFWRPSSCVDGMTWLLSPMRLAMSLCLEIRHMAGLSLPNQSLWSRFVVPGNREPLLKTAPLRRQRIARRLWNKAPPPYKQVQSAPAGPPPAAVEPQTPGGTGSYSAVAKGATSKTAQPNKVPKKPPPERPPGGWPDDVKTEQVQPAAPTETAPPARLPAEGTNPPACSAAPPAGAVTVEEQQAMAAQANEQQLAAVAQAAQLLEASGLSRPHPLTTSGHCGPQNSRYRPEQLQQDTRWSGGYSAWRQGGQSRQPDWGHEADESHETSYGPACEHHPHHQGGAAAAAPRDRGWQRKPRNWQYQPSDESSHKRRPGGPDRREKGSKARQGEPAWHNTSDLLVDARPGELRITGNDDKLSALGKTGAAALATGSNHKASKALRATGRVFIKLMQASGKLENSKTAFGYTPSYRQLGRLRAFTTQARGSGEPDPLAAGGGRGPGAPAVRLTPAEIRNSRRNYKMEDSDEGFHDPRDDVEPEPGEPAAVAPAEEYQISLREELLQRAAEAVAGARRSPEPRTFDQDVDFGEEDELSDL